MKKKKHLQTNFLRFIVEKYNAEIQELPEEEETNCPDEELVDEYDKIVGYGYGDEQDDEVQDEEETPENDDETVDNLIKEYRSLQKKYKMKTNGIHNKRK